LKKAPRIHWVEKTISSLGSAGKFGYACAEEWIGNFLFLYKKYQAEWIKELNEKLWHCNYYKWLFYTFQSE
jgi:hypothetical protein